VLTSCILAVTLVSRPSIPASPGVALQPLGEVSERVVENLARNLSTFLGLKVTVLPMKHLPESAYYAPRRRYRAEDLVAFLDRTTSPAVSHVIGITARDISAPKGAVADWGVFGVAKLGGRPGVISTYRLHAGHLRAGDVSESVFETRLGRVAAHELAHSLGLPHCATSRCLMNDAGGSIQSVDGASGFCERCARALAEKLR
jgi:archaemetzincin